MASRARPPPVNKLLKTRLSIVQVWQEKYGVWRECSNDCGEYPTDEILQTLYQVHGDTGFFRWHPSMDREKWDEYIYEEQTYKPSFVSFEDPSNEMKNHLNNR